MLVRLLARIAAGHYRRRDFAVDRLRAALRAVHLHFPVYRTYITGRAVCATDRAIIDRAIDAARADWTGTDAEIFDFLHDVLTLDLIAAGRSGYSQRAGAALRLQGAAVHRADDGEVAGGHRLLSLSPAAGAQRGRRRADASALVASTHFHERMSERAANCAARHDGDGHARHQARRGRAHAHAGAFRNAPRNGRGACGNGGTLNERADRTASGARAPSPAHEYMIYQALVGAWPLDGRIDELRRAHAGLRDQGGARRQGRDELDQPGRGLREGADGISSRHSRSGAIQAFHRFVCSASRAARRCSARSTA